MEINNYKGTNTNVFIIEFKQNIDCPFNNYINKHYTEYLQ